MAHEIIQFAALEGVDGFLDPRRELRGIDQPGADVGGLKAGAGFVEEGGLVFGVAGGAVQ